ncbi:hypothetical protein [Yeosuana marina]|uniref:hypothetical protein n=1 Tax=Yeosuana marina TaxID=1565536 RepID=UPI0014218BEC|nr:hypothetical protein [Yeosuana marina]
MIEGLPIYVSVFFILIVLLTIVFLFKSIINLGISFKKITLIFFVLLIWIITQSMLAFSGFYSENPNILPPRIMLFGILPPLIVIVFLFITKKRNYLKKNLLFINLINLNIIRLPVEIVLFLLFINGFVPEIMTFEGLNFDILVGITAPLVAYFGITKKRLNYKAILAWNIVSILLLFNIIALAILSAPSPFQKLGFNQANIAIFYFPFVLLPTFIVPVVLFAQLCTIYLLVGTRKIPIENY